MIKLIAAHDRLRVIGDRGQIPWSLPEDMRLFKERTIGHACIMGRNTWMSLQQARRPLYALPGRSNYVITSTPNKFDDVYAKLPENTLLYFLTYEQMVKQLKVSKGVARQFGIPELEADFWVIGGEKIYEQFINDRLVDRLLISEVDGEHAGDAFFPQLPPDDFHPMASASYQGFRVVEYHRKPR